MTRSIPILPAALALMLVAAPTVAQAQQSEVQPIIAQHSFSIKPLNAVFGVYTGEYERALSEANTVGVLASTFGVGDVRYISVDGKYRHYFGGVAFDGFSLAGTGGVTSLSVGCAGWEGNGCETERVWGLAAGLELGYTFLLGQQRNFSLSLDAGAQRIFPMGDIRDETDGFWFAMPTGGISVGYVLP
jgi:hypothetical protein